ncbi:MAG: antibiotic biosynthesis monooxygenase [Phycisphaerae bacterium]|nr:MAG: antibiotic biosynthesis monooxygenase [Planctomycetota bacterium]KAB2938441.1 MAG: antibiotic biosynthesis monooxygenase [Phycisphaerae bacterium]MBE7458811.1 antibiotic biosynthesis monooxygenase [Planctomycetia bacterium]MCK6465868.1 antibiotic biosynthesis monooxygenase [Phycisphaerae bacterium]MCL4719655.1 antibiotic biosynthesis monooxygenase [Phycisphaerae bacterium]
MITVGMNYDILPGKEQQFERVFDKVLGVMKGMSGHKESHLYRNVAAPQSYLIISEWTDPQAFQAFIASDQFRNVANWGKEQILASRPKHEIYGMESKTAPATPPPPAAGRCPVAH